MRCECQVILSFVSQMQTQLLGVAVPPPLSWLIADVPLDNVFSLMLGVATPKVARYGEQPIWGAYTRTAIIARTDWEKYDAEI